MKNDLIFSCIAIPFTIGFGMTSAQPLWAMAVFAAMLLLRYAGAPASVIIASQPVARAEGENRVKNRYLGEKSPSAVAGA